MHRFAGYAAITFAFALIAAAGLLWWRHLHADYDPLATARAAAGQRIANVEARVPPQCYTKTDGVSNPCWTCHTASNGRNRSDDWPLQERYRFTALAAENHWTNLFVDRRPAIAGIADDRMLAYVRQDNYTPLRAAMVRQENFPGWRPDLDFRQGFDAQGFARDGSGWRAYRYKPFPGTFWPTNGSADDAFIRLPQAFRRDAGGRDSRAVYQANLAIVEAAVTVPDSTSDTALRRKIEPVDEAAAGLDLDGDGHVGGVATQIHGLPSHYAGAASAIAVKRDSYPAGTEFLHTLHYLDPAAPEQKAVRMKEVRYAVKRLALSDADLQAHYAEEAREGDIGGRPHYSGNAYTGQTNIFGWTYQGYIEGAQGRLRLQTREEQLYCMGCHTGLGVTVDQSFSLPRKPPGAAGWGLQKLAGIPDAPEAGSDEPEYLRYLRRVGGGDEFRANGEMLARFFPGGVLDRAAVRRATAHGILGLIEPSRERALALDKSYWLIVREQSYDKGRDAMPQPVANVHREITDDDTGLKAAGRIYKDGRLWLDWDAKSSP
ncbi:MAG: hypothetical protein ACRETM_04210 [Stenotrophobium sp.]